MSKNCFLCQTLIIKEDSYLTCQVQFSISTSIQNVHSKCGLLLAKSSPSNIEINMADPTSSFFMQIYFSSDSYLDQHCSLCLKNHDINQASQEQIILSCPFCINKWHFSCIIANKINYKVPFGFLSCIQCKSNEHENISSLNNSLDSDPTHSFENTLLETLKKNHFFPTSNLI